MKFVPRAVVEERWRLYRLERHREKRQALKGIDVLIQIDDGHKIQFRGRHYGVPPVPWPLSEKALAAQERVAALMENPKAATLADWDQVCRTVTWLFARLCTPPDGIKARRYLWRLHWRLCPLAGATIGEVVQVLGFFCVFLRLGDGSFPTAQGPRPLGISPSTTPRTPRTSRNGATGKGAQRRGSTS